LLWSTVLVTLNLDSASVPPRSPSRKLPDALPDDLIAVALYAAEMGYVGC
jgi:hypothetical protein